MATCGAYQHTKTCAAFQAPQYPRDLSHMSLLTSYPLTFSSTLNPLQLRLPPPGAHPSYSSALLTSSLLLLWSSPCTPWSLSGHSFFSHR